MKKRLTFAKSNIHQLRVTTGENVVDFIDKKWTFSNVYYFTEIRDVLLLIKDYDLKTAKSIYTYCTKLNIKAFQKPWTERKALEYLNALKNFGVLDIETSEIIEPIDFKSNFNQPLHTEDFIFFKRIFFSYFRFKEVMSWFFDPPGETSQDNLKKISEKVLKTNSTPLFSFASKSRFHDTFFYRLENNADLYVLEFDSKDKTSELLKRFWDVFIKWGKQLSIIQKFNLDIFDIKTLDNKNITCSYFINNEVSDITLKDFIKNNFNSRYIYLPELVLYLALNKRWSIEFAKNFVIAEYEKDKFSFSLDRTSEIFIKRGTVREDDAIFHPFYKNSYVSNIILL